MKKLLFVVLFTLVTVTAVLADDENGPRPQDEQPVIIILD